MSDLMESDDSGSNKTLTSELCEITGIDSSWAQALLNCANQDLNAAINMFYNEDGRNNQVPVVVIDEDDDQDVRNDMENNVSKASGSKDKEIVIYEDIDSKDTNKMQDNGNNVHMASINDVENNLTKTSSSKDKDEHFNEKLEEYDEEAMLEKALKDSEREFQAKEPDSSETFQILSTNFPDIDSTALRGLCEEYAGRSQELEAFIQYSRHTLPTKTEARMEAEKMELKAQLQELVAAGVEEAEYMVVESCPGCKKPKILENESMKVFVCENLECKGEFCRSCKKPQHVPDPCEGKERKVKLWDDSMDFQIINMKAKRSFDEDDELDKEFRLAEGQFLRLNGVKSKNILSIDLVHNKKLEERFEAKKKDLITKEGSAECLLLFHGTPQKNIRPILENNFDVSIIANGRALGNGVYFSECPEVSMGYSIDQKSLILCKVLRASNCVESRHPVVGGKRKKGVEMDRCWAVVVPDVDQILPKYVINFT